MFCPASDFFQYFNPSNACLQVIELIEFFPKAFPDFEETHPLMGYSNC